MRWIDPLACRGLCQLILDDKFRDQRASALGNGSPDAPSSGSCRIESADAIPSLPPGHVWVLAEPCGDLDVGMVVDPGPGSRGVGYRCVAHLGDRVAFAEMVSWEEQLGYARRRRCDVASWARRRPVLPAHLYRDCIAPFLSFAAPLPNMLYVCGGRNMHDGPLSSVEMFDTWSGKWVVSPAMPRRRAGSTAAALPDGRILILGGYDEHGTELGVLSSCDIYDPAQQRWIADGAPALQRARWGHGCAVLGGTVYVVGGCSRQKTMSEQAQHTWGRGMETLRSTERWSPQEDAWVLCGSLQTPRAGVRVAALQDRYLLAAGGNEDVFGGAGSNSNLDTVELYDTQLACWSCLCTSLTVPRATAGVAALDSSRVLIVGGSQNDAVVHSSAEIFSLEPEEESFRVSSSERVVGLAQGRMGTQAVQLCLPKPGGLFPTSVQPCIAVVGGECLGSLFSRQLACIPVYDIEKMAWRTDSMIPPMCVPRTAAAVCVANGHPNPVQMRDGLRAGSSC